MANAAAAGPGRAPPRSSNTDTPGDDHAGQDKGPPGFKLEAQEDDSKALSTQELVPTGSSHVRFRALNFRDCCLAAVLDTDSGRDCPQIQMMTTTYRQHWFQIPAGAALQGLAWLRLRRAASSCDVSLRSMV